jgi:hypothetical protein
VSSPIGGILNRLCARKPDQGIDRCLGPGPRGVERYEKGSCGLRQERNMGEVVEFL